MKKTEETKFTIELDGWNVVWWSNRNEVYVEAKNNRKISIDFPIRDLPALIEALQAVPL